LNKSIHQLHLALRDDPTIAQLVDDNDETLFAAVMHNDKHVPHYILPDRQNYSYSLRPRRHKLILATKRDSRNVLKKNCYSKTLY